MKIYQKKYLNYLHPKLACLCQKKNIWYNYRAIFGIRIFSIFLIKELFLVKTIRCLYLIITVYII